MVLFSPHNPCLSKIMSKLGGEGGGGGGEGECELLSRQNTHKFVGKFALITLQYFNSKVPTNRQTDNKKYINNVEKKEKGV